MANDLNQCSFIGRLGADVEMRYMPSGDAVASFSIAVGSQWKDKASGEKRESVEWVNITAFGKLGEICGEYLRKGSQVYVSGRLKTEKYQAKDGLIVIQQRSLRKTCRCWVAGKAASIHQSAIPIQQECLAARRQSLRQMVNQVPAHRQQRLVRSTTLMMIFLFEGYLRPCLIYPCAKTRNAQAVKSATDSRQSRAQFNRSKTSTNFVPGRMSARTLCRMRNAPQPHREDSHDQH